MHYVFYDLTDGQITISGMVSDSVANTLSAPNGQGVILTEIEVDPDAVRVDLTTLDLVPYSTAGQFRKRRLASQDGFRWNPVTEDWIDERPIEHVREDLLRRLKRERDQRIESGFVWDGSTFQSDPQISQPRLLGLYSDAVIDNFPLEGEAWRLADNSWRILSKEDAIAIWNTFKTHLRNHFQVFAVHESTISAETDIEVLRLYDVTSGWPS